MIEFFPLVSPSKLYSLKDTINKQKTTRLSMKTSLMKRRSILFGLIEKMASEIVKQIHYVVKIDMKIEGELLC